MLLLHVLSSGVFVREDGKIQSKSGQCCVLVCVIVYARVFIPLFVWVCVLHRIFVVLACSPAIPSWTGSLLYSKLSSSVLHRPDLRVAIARPNWLLR